MKFHLIILYIVIFLLGFSVEGKANDSQERKKQILIISSYSPLNEHNQKVISAFSNYINDQKKVFLTVEHMNCESLPYFTQWEKWMSQLFTAYIQKPDLILILGSEAWAAYRESCPSDWRSTPTILGNLDKFSVDFSTFNDPQTFDPMKRISVMTTLQNFNITGYYRFSLELDNARLIQTLQPEINTLLYLDDNRYNFKFSEFIINAASQKCNFSLKYLNGQERSTEDVVQIIKQSSIRDALLSKNWTSDVTLSPHAETILHNEIRSIGNRIVYNMQENNMLNDENLGGCFVSCKDIGEDLAKLTIKALTKGIKACPLMSLTPSKPKIYLNYNALIRGGINFRNIPKDAIIVNNPPSPFDTYKSEIVIIGLFILCMIIVCIILLISHKKNEKSYQNLNKQTRKILYAIPETSIIIDYKYTIHDIILPQKSVLFSSYDLNSFIGRNIRDISLQFPDFKETARIVRDTVRHTVISHAPQRQEGFVNNHYIQISSIILDNTQIACFFRDITDLRNAQSILQKNTLFVQDLINTIPLGIGIRNASDHFKYVFCNNLYKEYYHCPSIREGITDEEAQNPLATTFKDEDITIYKNQNSNEYARTIYDTNKKPSLWLKSYKLYINGLGNSEYIIDICSNVTQQRQTESVVLRMQQELDIAFETGVLFVWSFDAVSQQFSSLNRFSSFKQGSTIEEALKHINVHDHEKFKDFMFGLLNGTTGNICSNFRFLTDTTEKWMEIHAYSIKNDFGKIYRIIGIGHDITIQMQREKELENSKARLELAMKASGYFEWSYNVKSQQFSSNDSLSIFHKGITINDLDKYIHPDDFLDFKNNLQEILKGDVNIHNGIFRGRKGSDMPYLYYEYVICTFEKDIDSNEIISIIGLHKNVTEQHDKIEKLELIRERSDEANKMKSAFLANMSHEIRTPVNAIVGFANLIAECDDRETRREYYNIIETNNELLLQLISDILDLSKIEAGQLAFSYSDFCLNDLFSELQQIYSHSLKKELTFNCNVPSAKYIIKSDKKRITQVLSNFMSNANKYTSAGSIELGFSILENKLKCYVKDTGEGIALSNHDKVFGRFHKFNKTVSGTGLGLSICKNIIEHLNGVIGFESKEGEGSTFWFTFPLNVVVGINNDYQKGNPESHKNKIPTVLLGSHSNSLHTLISCILKRSYTLIYASDGVMLLDMYKRNLPDLILMDVVLPEINGIDAAKHIRESNSNIPIIGLTESLFDENNERMIQAGCTSTISKPINSIDLLTTLENLLKKNN